MVALPLITRELRIAARSAATYRLRVSVAAIAIVVLGMALVSALGERGLYLFGQVHHATMLILAVVGALLTADCISRERREGTLDLLLLTPLTDFKLVAAKFVAQLLRILSIWAVILPISVVPLLAGGVAPKDVMVALYLEGTIILLSLAGGMLASVVSKRQLPAILLALGIAALFLWADWKFLTLGNAAGPRRAQSVLAVNLGYAAAATAMVLVVISRVLARRREKAGSSARAEWMRKVFLTPVFWRGLFQRRMRKRMETNPLIWLEYRTAWSRVGGHVMLGFVVIVESYALSSWNLGRMPVFHLFAGMVILTVMALTSASSFQRERENGAFELLLVAPFTEKSLLEGRVRAVWGYYLPTGIVFLILVLLVGSLAGSPGRYWRDEQIQMARSMSAMCSIVTIPLAGFYFALRLKHFISIFLATVSAGLILPMIFCQFFLNALVFLTSRLPGAIGTMTLGLADRFAYVQWTLVLHALLIGYFWLEAQSCLKKRNFA